MLKGRFLSLICCLLMMCAAALCVNKTLFFSPEKAHKEASTDTISVAGDGTQIVHTDALSDVSGYGGPVPLDIYIKDGKITKIEALPNGETPSFFERASKMLDSWVGKTPEQALALKADGVSGATFSSTAIKANVEAGLTHYLQSPPKDSAPDVPLKVWIALGVTLAACIFPLFVKSRKYHIVQLIANIAILGFWCGQFLDYTVLLHYLSEGIELPAGLAAIAMLTAAFIYPLFGRPQHYCNHICPLGSAQILMSEIVPFKIRMSPATVKVLDWFRKILWGALMVLLWADVATEWMDLELFQAFMFKSASWGIIAAAILFVVLSGVISRPYCRFVCPTGSLIKRAENIG